MPAWLDACLVGCLAGWILGWRGMSGAALPSAVAGAERSWPTNCMALFAQIRCSCSVKGKRQEDEAAEGRRGRCLFAAIASAFYNIFIPFKRARAAHTPLCNCTGAAAETCLSNITYTTCAARTVEEFAAGARA